MTRPIQGSTVIPEGCSASSAPHCPQKRAATWFSVAHWGQNGTESRVPWHLVLRYTQSAARSDRAALQTITDHDDDHDPGHPATRVKRERNFSLAAARRFWHCLHPRSGQSWPLEGVFGRGAGRHGLVAEDLRISREDSQKSLLTGSRR